MTLKRKIDYYLKNTFKWLDPKYDEQQKKGFFTAYEVLTNGISKVTNKETLEVYTKAVENFNKLYPRQTERTTALRMQLHYKLFDIENHMNDTLLPKVERKEVEKRKFEQPLIDKLVDDGNSNTITNLVKIEKDYYF